MDKGADRTVPYLAIEEDPRSAVYDVLCKPREAEKGREPITAKSACDRGSGARPLLPCEIFFSWDSIKETLALGKTLSHPKLLFPAVC